MWYLCQVHRQICGKLGPVSTLHRLLLTLRWQAHRWIVAMIHWFGALACVLMVNSSLRPIASKCRIELRQSGRICLRKKMCVTYGEYLSVFETQQSEKGVDLWRSSLSDCCTARQGPGSHSHVAIPHRSAGGVGKVVSSLTRPQLSA